MAVEAVQVPTHPAVAGILRVLVVRAVRAVLVAAGATPRLAVVVGQA